MGPIEGQYLDIFETWRTMELVSYAARIKKEYSTTMTFKWMLVIFHQSPYLQSVEETNGGAV